MGIYDFVVGILVGIVLACAAFVLQTSQVSAIRGTLPGGLASSMVRRHPTQRRFLQEVGSQTYVMKLAGFLFVSSSTRIQALGESGLTQRSLEQSLVWKTVFELFSGTIPSARDR